MLAEIGTHLNPQVGRITVRLPRALAEAAVAAWNRDELAPIGEESPAQYEAREAAADLALIGLALSDRGVPDGDEVSVDLDVTQVAAALRAAW